MKNINFESIKQDLHTVRDMLRKYSEAVYEPQEGQKGHYDNQPKLIRIIIEDIRCGLSVARDGLDCLFANADCLIED